MKHTIAMPETIRDEEHLEDLLSTPGEGVLSTMSRLKGDVIVLGVGGKMGPTLARMIRRASEKASGRKVIGVARFSAEGVEKKLQAWGIETIACDLMDHRQLGRLPDAPYVIYMAGRKFGATSNEPLTWAMNSFLPGTICQKYRRSHIVAFSTGNVYGLVPVSSGGSIESDALDPEGDYAMSCLGRERIFEHFSNTLGIPVSLIRLNYAVEMRYGVLADLAQRVAAGQPVDLSMGSVNVIWQGDANAMVVRALDHAATPPFIVNVAGPEILSVRRLAEEFGRLLERKVEFTGVESATALLSNAQLAHRLFGYPSVAVGQVLRWVADWVKRGGASLSKPTHFEVRDGRF